MLQYLQHGKNLTATLLLCPSGCNCPPMLHPCSTTMQLNQTGTTPTALAPTMCPSWENGVCGADPTPESTISLLTPSGSHTVWMITHCAEWRDEKRSHSPWPEPVENRPRKFISLRVRPRDGSVITKLFYRWLITGCGPQCWGKFNRIDVHSWSFVCFAEGRCDWMCRSAVGTKFHSTRSRQMYNIRLITKEWAT